MSITSKIVLLFTLSYVSFSANSKVYCNDCISLTGTKVMVNEVGVVGEDGEGYLYAFTNMGKIQLTPRGFDLAKLALVYSKLLYVSTGNENFSLISD